MIDGTTKIPDQKIDDAITDTHILFKQDFSIYPEDYFRGMLIMERKRSERTENPFMLMLMDLSKIENNNQRTKVVKKLSKMFNTCTRETDIKGWYKKNSALGIIYTELSNNGHEFLIEKMTKHIQKTFSSTIAQLINITYHFFPESEGKGKALKDKTNEILYKTHSHSVNKRISLMGKRCLDIAGSLFGITLCLPFFIIIPMLIKLTSKGPVFFRQKRVGRFGKEFSFYKFRSMRTDNNTTAHQKFVKDFITGAMAKDAPTKIKDDPRVTKIGKFIRKTSLDEIPQFFNVLRGDMSLVGPRPPIPYEVEEYNTWHKCRVLEARPGITGHWQVYGRSRCDFENMVRMDLNYIKQWTLLRDLKLILQTPIALLTAKGAY